MAHNSIIMLLHKVLTLGISHCWLFTFVSTSARVIIQVQVPNCPGQSRVSNQNTSCINDHDGGKRGDNLYSFKKFYLCEANRL